MFPSTSLWASSFSEKRGHYACYLSLVVVEINLATAQRVETPDGEDIGCLLLDHWIKLILPANRTIGWKEVKFSIECFLNIISQILSCHLFSSFPILFFKVRDCFIFYDYFSVFRFINYSPVFSQEFVTLF